MIVQEIIPLAQEILREYHFIPYLILRILLGNIKKKRVRVVFKYYNVKPFLTVPLHQQEDFIRMMDIFN